MQKPRNIASYQVLLVVAIIVFLWVTNVISQTIWGLFYYVSEMFRGGFGESRYYQAFEFHFLVPVLVGIVVAVIYTILALSPIGISILKSNLGVRPVMTDAEKSFLDPIHDEVFSSIKEKFPNAVKRRLYMFDSADINAFCMNAGSDIAIHRGSTQTFNDEEMKALIAHEYAHSYYKDGLLNTFFMGAYYGMLFIYIWPFISEFRAFYSIVGTGNLFSWAFLVILVGIVIKFWLMLAKLVMLPFTLAIRSILRLFGTDLSILVSKAVDYGQLFYIQNVSFMIISRQQEYRADEFACYIGYKYGMESVLRIFYEMEYQPLFGLLNKVFAEYPSTAKRIANVEKFRE